MTLPTLAFLPLTGAAAGPLEQVPARPGVGQIVAGERSLVLGMASNLRRWAASHLGLGRKPAPGRRPRPDLSGIATGIRWAEVDGPFRQRLLFERLMAPLVPLAARRDLKPPVFLHLDAGERFPRASIRTGAVGDDSSFFGPFASRKAAETARDELHRLFRLRPCEYSFEPDPALPLGTGCLFAQVRSCAAPCLRRVSEDEYRALAGRAVAWLAEPSAREGSRVPPLVTSSHRSRLVVVDKGRRDLALFPVQAGRVLDEAVLLTSRDDVEATTARLAWPEVERPQDWPWLAGWLSGPRGKGSYVLTLEGEEPEPLAARIRELPALR